MRDSELLAMPRAAFLDAVQKHPAILLELMRTMITRSRNERTVKKLAVTFGFLGAGEGPPIRALVERLQREVEKNGARLALLTPSIFPHRPNGFPTARKNTTLSSMLQKRAKQPGPRIACARPTGASGWRGEAEPPPAAPFSVAHATLKPADLLLVHPPECRASFRRR